MPQILWPDVTALTVAYLRPRIIASSLPFAATVRVSNKLTAKEGDPRPDYAVIVRDDGGPQVGDVRAISRIGFNVWALTDNAASNLAAITEALLAGMAEENVTAVVKSVVTRSYPVPDDSGRPLRTGSAELTVRGINL